MTPGPLELGVTFLWAGLALLFGRRGLAFCCAPFEAPRWGGRPGGPRLLGAATLFLGFVGILGAAPLAAVLSRGSAFLAHTALVGLLAGTLLALLRRSEGAAGATAPGRRGVLRRAGVLWLLAAPFARLLQLSSLVIAEWLGEELEPQAMLERVRVLVETGAHGELAALALGLVVGVPFYEEVLFRALLLGGALHHLVGRLETRTGVWLAVLLSTVFFTLVHPPATFVPVAFLGLVLGTVYARTGSLLLVGAFHVLHNALTLLELVLRL